MPLAGQLLAAVLETKEGGDGKTRETEKEKEKITTTYIRGRENTKKKKTFIIQRHERKQKNDTKKRDTRREKGTKKNQKSIVHSTQGRERVFFLCLLWSSSLLL